MRRKLAPYLALTIMLACFYGATFTFRPITDTDLNHEQTRALVLHGDVDVYRYNPSKLRFAIRRGDHQYSIYGVGISVLTAPIYLITSHTHLSHRMTHAAVAIPSVIASVVAMYWLLLKLFDKQTALASMLIFAFGTTMWPLAAMAFFVNGPIALLQLLGMMALFSQKKMAPLWAGVAFGTAFFVRPTLVIFLLVVGLFYLTQGIRPAMKFGLGSLAPIAGVLVQNRWIWGSWFKSGYSYAGVGFHGNVPKDLFGLLFGWWRGLFVYTPILLVAVVGFILVARKRHGFVEKRLLVLGLASIVTLFFYARWTTWWGGLNQFGYRYLLDIVPPLIRGIL